ncbi:MAG: hypothetical protein OER95_13295 [Acidimicrobiia bacterium]|nr:hypothetical protein [Acidimicrobiia bacterium]
MAPDPEDNPLEQLIELLIYAPIGLLYEYPEVLPRLIKRGRSQVQLAKFAGQLALKQQQHRSGQATHDESPSMSPDTLVDGVARLITELGSMIGLAPPHQQPRPGGEPTGADRAVDEAVPARPSDTDGQTRITATPSPSAGEADASGHVEHPKPTARLPVANYDDLTAKEVIFLLEDLTVSQLRRVRDHEKHTRNRKTVLSKIDRLLS